MGAGGSMGPGGQAKLFQILRTLGLDQELELPSNIGGEGTVSPHPSSCCSPSSLLSLGANSGSSSSGRHPMDLFFSEIHTSGKHMLLLPEYVGDVTLGIGGFTPASSLPHPMPLPSLGMTQGL